MSSGWNDSGSAIISSKNIEKETKKYKTLKTKKSWASFDFVITKLVYGKFHLLKIKTIGVQALAIAVNIKRIVFPSMSFFKQFVSNMSTFQQLLNQCHYTICKREVGQPEFQRFFKWIMKNLRF
jgi:hypothetical protein